MPDATVTFSRWFAIATFAFLEILGASLAMLECLSETNVMWEDAVKSFKK